MTPARHMQTCVPLPVPRAQQRFTMWRSTYERNAMIVETEGVLFACVGWYSTARVLRHFGPRRHR